MGLLCFHLLCASGFSVVSVKKCSQSLYVNLIAIIVLPNLFTTARSWCVASLGCCLYSVTLPYHGSHTSLLLVSMPFISVSYLIVARRIFSPMLDRRNAFWALSSSDLAGRPQLVTVEHYVCCGLVLHSFYYVEISCPMENGMAAHSRILVQNSFHKMKRANGHRSWQEYSPES